MENVNQTNDLLTQHRQQVLPSMLNILTILTFIGCGLAYLRDCSNFIFATDPQKQIEKIQEAQEKMGDNNFLSKLMAGSAEVIQKSYDNRYLLIISGLLFTTFCLIGAIQMRKLKKGGYYLYLIGELAPIVVMAGLFGSSFVGAIGLLFRTLIAVILVILYSTQLKHFN